MFAILMKILDYINISETILSVKNEYSWINIVIDLFKILHKIRIQVEY